MNVRWGGRRHGNGRDGRFTLVLCCWWLLSALLLMPTVLAAAPLAEETGVVLERLLAESRPPLWVSLGRDWPLDDKTLSAFYRQRGYRPAWSDNTGVSPLAAELLDELRSLGRHGLCVEDYLIEPIAQLLRQADDCRRFGLLYDGRDLALLDLLLSEAFFRVSADLGSGRVRGAAFHGRSPVPRRPEPAALYGELLTRSRVADYLESLLPLEPGYLRLLQTLEAYRLVAVSGGWPRLEAGPLPPLGGSDPRLATLRRRLELSGDLATGESEAQRPYDAATEAALLRFQRRQGLPGDGQLSAATLEALNVPVEQRIRQIELNLERARWLPRTAAEREVRVNIAAFSLTASRDGVVELTMPVVVGSAYRQTPVYSSLISRIEFAPYWTVPRTILAEDKLPKLRRDPGYLKAHHYQIIRIQQGAAVAVDPATVDWKKITPATFPGLLRMQPGPWNPLGRVKFLFANPHDVYLHDTSDPQLFAREERNLSSGCIRVARPVELALFLLDEEGGWDAAAILAAMSRKEPLPVYLARPVPVHIVYATAWVDDAGELQLRRDFYLRDHELEQALLELSARRQPTEGSR